MDRDNLLSDFNMNGTFPSGANKAEITMKLSDTPAGDILTADNVTDGQAARPVMKADIQIKLGSIAANNR